MDTVQAFEETPSIYEGSVASIRSELNLFELLPTDVSTTNATEYIQCFPLVSTREASAPLEFVLNLETVGYFDPQDSFLSLTCRILRQDSTKLDASNLVSPSHNFFQNLFQSLEVYINGQLVSDSHNNYRTIAYLHRLLTYSEEQKRNLLKDELWIPDTTPETFAVADAGWNQRYELGKLSQQFTVSGSLVANVLTQPRFIPSGSEIRILLRSSLPQFCLDASYATKEPYNGCPYVVSIDSAVFYASKKSITQRVNDMHKSLHKTKPYLFPITELQLRNFSITTGLSHFTTEGIILGKLPRIIVFGKKEKTT